jgi:predicted Rossmann-fold nucleotide-binding protein
MAAAHQQTEIESMDQWHDHVASKRSFRGWHIHGLDLRGVDLAAIELVGSVFLGCRFDSGVESDIRRRGGLVFPRIPDVPFNPYRPNLYTADELYDGLTGGYSDTPDGRIWAWSQQLNTLDHTLAAALHDHAVDDALAEYARARRFVGVMGGHAVRRGTSDYLQAARLGHQLAQHWDVATGGGPGAMEAANLGAWLARHPFNSVEVACQKLAQVPQFTPDATAWASLALEVKASFEPGTASLGVPTWHYGHEPPNAFATDIAKYFANSIREHVLLDLCDEGVIFLPGSAGTVQEIFQAGCEKFYDRTTVSPMVLVGYEHWTDTYPAWPLLRALFAERSDLVHLVDSIDEAVAVLRG